MQARSSDCDGHGPRRGECAEQLQVSGVRVDGVCGEAPFGLEVAEKRVDGRLHAHSA